MPARGSVMERSFRTLNEQYAAPPGAATFRASGAFDKLAGLVLLVVVSAALGAFLLPPALALAAVVVAFVLVVASYFRPMWSRYLAPAYAVTEGVALGVVSRLYGELGGGIVPLAVLFTGGVYVACLAAYRSGLVRVTPKWFTVALIGAAGLAAVFVASLFGLPIPGINDFNSPLFLLFSLVALGIGVISLFVDFAYVDEAEKQCLDARGEWYAAFAMLTALVLVYIEMLRILAYAYGGGRRR